MVGSTWLRGIPWDALGMTPKVFEPADIDTFPFEQVTDPQELGSCEIILVFVSGGIAEIAIQSVFGPAGTSGPREILDFSSNGPEHKKRTSDWCAEQGCAYVDATILGAVAAGGLKTPLAIAGSPSEPASALLSASDAPLLNVENAEAGAAARLKLVRSIVTKGLEALACEAQSIADEFALADDYRRVFADFETGSFTTIMNSMVDTHPDHRERRGKEMREVITMVEGRGKSSALLNAVALNFEQGPFRTTQRS